MYICICNGVTSRQIEQAVEQGAASYKDVKNALGLASQCGQCGKMAKQLFEKHRDQLIENTDMFYQVA